MTDAFQPCVGLSVANDLVSIPAIEHIDLEITRNAGVGHKYSMPISINLSVDNSKGLRVIDIFEAIVRELVIFIRCYR